MQAARETRNAAPDGNVAVARVRCPVRTLVRRAHEQAVARESLAGLLTSTEPPRASTSMKDFTQVRRGVQVLNFGWCSQRVSIPQKGKKKS